jgi:hypothetical protein
MSDGTRTDVDRIAATAQRLGLVAPDCQGPDDDDGTDQVVIVIHIAGGLVADVGAPRGARVRVVVVDDDVLEAGESSGVWAEGVTALDAWPRDAGSALTRAAGELPRALRHELGLGGAE